MELFDFGDLDDKQPCEDVLIDVDNHGLPRGNCTHCPDCSAWTISRTFGRTDRRTCTDCGCPPQHHVDLTPWVRTLYRRQVQVLTGPSYKNQKTHQDQAWNEHGDEEFGLHAGEGIYVKDPMVNGIPLVAWQKWDHIEARLFVHSDGLFHPRRQARIEDETDGREPSLPSSPRSAARVAAAKPDNLLVSVICPTITERRRFHSVIYDCFCQQIHPNKELIFVETGFEPSAFLAKLARKDRRVVHKFFRSPGREWPVGLKRNIACYLARGEVIIHFDDDDLYAPGYVSLMLDAVLRGVRRACERRSFDRWSRVLRVERDLPPAAATLGAWHTLDLSSQRFGYLDAENDPKAEGCREGWVYGWGFSFAYTRSAWRLEPFAEVTHCEDFEFMKALMAVGVPVELPREARGHGLCAHTYHAATSTSGAEFIDGERCGSQVEAPPALVGLLPLLARSNVVQELERSKPLCRARAA